jgi:hypothetical protein
VTLETVLTTWPPDPDYEWLFGTLCSESESEASLKALSALLPIGLLWEAQGTQERAVEELRKVDRANMPAFERQIQDYVCSRIAKDENHEARQRELLSQYSQWFEKLGGAETVLQQMDDLCNSETVASWNDKLAKLRDEWLKEPPS